MRPRRCRREAVSELHEARYMKGATSHLPEFGGVTHVGSFGPRANNFNRLKVTDVPADVLEIVRRDVIGYGRISL